MAGPQIDISAQTQSAEAALRRLTDAFNKLGQAAAGATRTKFQVIGPEELGHAQELEDKLRQIMHMHPSIRSAVRASNQNPSAPTSVNWANVPLTPSQVRTMMGHLSGGANRFTGISDPAETNRLGESIALAVGRFFGGVGGGVGQVGGSAVGGAASGGGMGGLLRGGLLGAGLFAAFKGGQMVSEVYDSAKTLALEMDKLKRQMGDLGVNFNVLQLGAERAAQGLEINSVEAGKLMTEFNRLAGGVKDTGDLVGGTRTGAGMSKALGLDPSAGVGFLANIRNITRGGSADGDRKLALMIGDVVTRSGMNARADDVLQAIQSFAAATSRISLTNPNLAGFGGAYAGMLSARIPGLTSENAAALLGQANSAMQNMGAFGEGSETFTLSALGRYGSLNPIQARILSEGGMFGTRGGSFGAGSLYRRYMKQNGSSDADIDKLIGENGDVTNFQAIRKQLDSMQVAPELKAEMAKNFFGLSSISQAMALLSTSPEEIGKTEKLLGSRGINIRDYNESGIMTLSKIANAGGLSDLEGVAGDLLGRKGKGALTNAEQQKLTEAMAEAQKRGGSEGFKYLQDTLADLAANKDKQETLGSQMLDQQKKIETAMTNVGQMLLGPINTMRDALLVAAGIGSGKLREKAAGLEKNDINEEIDKKIEAERQKYLKDGTAGSAKMRRMLGAPGADDEYVRQREQAEAEYERRKTELEEERKRRIGAVDANLESQRQAEEAGRSVTSGASSRDQSRLSRVKLTDEQERTLQEVSGGDAQKAAFLRNVLKIENRGKSEVDNNAVSPAGARGAYQFMPNTAATLARRLGMDNYDLTNFNDSSRLAGAYYDELYERYRGNRAKMYADYNGGPRLAANAVATGNRENDQYVAMGLALDKDGSATPRQVAAGQSEDPARKMSSAPWMNSGIPATPVPAPGANMSMPNTSGPQMSFALWWAQNQEMTFRLVDQEGRQRAAPISVRVPTPASQGRG